MSIVHKTHKTQPMCRKIFFRIPRDHAAKHGVLVNSSSRFRAGAPQTCMPTEHRCPPTERPPRSQLTAKLLTVARGNVHLSRRHRRAKSRACDQRCFTRLQCRIHECSRSPRWTDRVHKPHLAFRSETLGDRSWQRNCIAHGHLAGSRAVPPIVGTSGQFVGIPFPSRVDAWCVPTTPPTAGSTSSITAS
jgi:hypothetical protein